MPDSCWQMKILTDISWKQLVDQCEQVIRSSMGVQRGGLGPTARRSHGGGGWIGGGGRPIGLESSNCPEAASPACVLNIINLLKWSTTDKGEQHICSTKVCSLTLLRGFYLDSNITVFFGTRWCCQTQGRIVTTITYCRKPNQQSSY